MKAPAHPPTWWSVLTTPPPPRPPPPKYPTFTTKFFSTKSWGPGHLVGAGILVVGMYAVVKTFVSRAQAATARRPAGPPPPPGADTALAQTENQRGEYGKKP